LIALIRGWLWRLRGFILFAPASIALAAACLFVFFVQQRASHVEFAYGYTFGQVLVSCFGLNEPLFTHGFFWQPLTYLFLHANGWHLAFNVATILLFGSGVEREVGGGRFWRIFLVGGVLAGLGWLGAEAARPFLPSLDVLTHWMPPGLRQALGAGRTSGGGLESSLLIGASGGVFALIGAYAALFPLRTVYLLLVFVPVRMKARTLVGLLIGLDVAAAIFVQLPIAHAAHISGCLAGYVFGLRLRQLGWADPE